MENQKKKFVIGLTKFLKWGRKKNHFTTTPIKEKSIFNCNFNNNSNFSNCFFNFLLHQKKR